jgi:hypothetical protein
MNKFKRKRNIMPPVMMKLSSTFVMKAICKHCGSHPVKYFYLDSKTSYKEPKHFKDEDEFLSKYLPINLKIRTQASVKSVVDRLSSYQYSTTDKFLSPKYHKVIKASKDDFGAPSINLMEFLVCECEKTEWSYSSLSVEDRPDIKNRQAGKKYPFKFKY